MGVGGEGIERVVVVKGLGLVEGLIDKGMEVGGGMGEGGVSGGYE